MRQPTAEEFLKDVTEHQLTVMHSDGIYRHLRFQKPKTMNHWFDLVTWPGFLTISGDMGCWTFARLEDMLTFFRSDKMAINASYWSEKLQHGTHGGRDGAKVWDEDLFREQIIKRLEHYDMDVSALKLVVCDLKDALDCESGNGPYAVRNAAYGFTWEVDGQKLQFDSCDMPDGMEYAYHFLWCLYAIVWGIQQFDKRPSLVNA